MNSSVAQHPVVALLLIAVFVVGALFNTKRFPTYSLVVLLAITPFYGTEFMPRELMGMTGMNFWNLIWFVTVLATIPLALSSVQFRQAPKYFSVPLIIFILALTLATAYAMIDIKAFPNLGPRSMSLMGVLLLGLVKPIQFLLLGWLAYVLSVYKGETRSIYRAILASAIIFGTLVLYFYFAGSHQVDEQSSVGYVAGREAVSAGTGMHANDVGAWATYGIIAAVLIPAEKGFWGVLRYVAIVMSFLAIVFSFSRTAYVAAPIVLLVAFRHVRMKERLFALGAFAVVVTLAAPLIMERAMFGLEEKHTSLNDVSAGRTDRIWKPLWEDVEENPVIGNGRFAQFRSKSFFKLGLFHAHSLYLQILLDMGSIGLIIVLVVMGNIFLVGRKARTMLPHLMMVMVMVGITGHSFYPDQSNYVVWVIYGVSLATIVLGRTQKSRRLRTDIEVPRRDLTYRRA